MAGRRAVDTVNGRRNDGARRYRSIGIAMLSASIWWIANNKLARCLLELADSGKCQGWNFSKHVTFQVPGDFHVRGAT